MGYNLQLGLVFSLIIIIIIIIKTTSPCLINSVKGAFCFYHQSLPMVLQAACDGDCCFFFFFLSAFSSTVSAFWLIDVLFLG